ncbi:MAG: FAD:protein FMN transferase [Rhodoferax sp.]
MPSPCSTAPVAVRRRHLTLAASLSACGLWILPVPAQAQPARQTQDTRVLMGTQVDLVVEHPDAALVRQALDAAWRAMSVLAQDMSRYEPDNSLARLHASAGRAPVAVSPALMQVLRTAQQVHERSHGAFDATVGSLTGWDFRPGHEQVPSPGALRQQLALVGQARALTLDSAHGSAYLRHAGVRLDLGGVAKLPILQAGLQALQAHGITRAMVNGGGDVLVSAAPGQAPWRIGVRDARAPQQLLGSITLRQGVVASSGDYERVIQQAGRQWHHVLDPHTGYSSRAAHGVVMVADAVDQVNGLGSAVMVAGTPLARALFTASSGVDALVVRSDRSLWSTPGMAQRLRAA